MHILTIYSNLERVTLEVGGKPPSLIFPDANIENALRHHSQNFLMNSSQACVAASRIFVHEDIADEIVKHLKVRSEQLDRAMGSPADAKMFFGPLVDNKQFERVIGFLHAGKNEAELVTGGVRKGESGFYVEPTIFLNPKDDACIFMASMPHALRLAKQIDAGNVNINTSQTITPSVPCGGSQRGGLGREGGRMGLMNYVEAKTFNIK
jgi:aldehyde dehydrogenase (NAD+)